MVAFLGNTRSGCSHGLNKIERLEKIRQCSGLFLIFDTNYDLLHITPLFYMASRCHYPHYTLSSINLAGSKEVKKDVNIVLKKIEVTHDGRIYSYIVKLIFSPNGSLLAAFSVGGFVKVCVCPRHHERSSPQRMKIWSLERLSRASF